MLGNLDPDAGDDTWSLMLKDREIASGGRYDRVSFTVSKGELSAAVLENVMDLAGLQSSSPYPLAAFEGLVTADRLQAMVNDPALLEAEATFFNQVLGEKMTLSAEASSVSSFGDSLAAHPLEFAGFVIGSAIIGMVGVLGVLRLLSPPKNSYSKVMDESTKVAAIELEKPLARVSPDLRI
jgi:hypothetical protein